MQIGNPRVSVVLPVRNEAAHAREFFGPLLNQTYPKDRMEVLVVDGMSEDGTREIVQEFVRENGHAKVRLLDNPRRQRAPALNVGIRSAKGDIILRVDARTIIPNDYVEKCVRTLLATGADNVGGMQVPIVTRNGSPRKELTQQAIGIALAHPFGIGNAQFRLGKKSGYVDTVYLGCFRREIFDKVGLFDEDAPVISEDSEMNYRIRKAGGKVYFNKDIVAYYHPRDNLRDLARLYFRYGGAKAGNLLKSRNLTAWRQWVPPLFLCALLVFGVGSVFSSAAKIVFASILGLYLLVDLFVCVRLAAREKRLALFHRLLAVFPTLHFSWATGFFARLVQRPKPGQYWGY
jgi:cellulose synthase/poly-beta-1,6-N-acetylglucosamine synthase-like glycosyltransferase